MKPSIAFFVVALCAAGLAAAPASRAQSPSGAPDHGAMHHGAAQPDAAAAPSSKAFTEAATRMHAAMNVPMTGDPDLDFLQGMVAHHEGAVAMAEVELRYGKDAEAKALARRIVEDQEAEIVLMKRMIEARTRATQ